MSNNKYDTDTYKHLSPEELMKKIVMLSGSLDRMTSTDKRTPEEALAIQRRQNLRKSLQDLLPALTIVSTSSKE